MPCSMPAALCILCLLYLIAPGIQGGRGQASVCESVCQCTLNVHTATLSTKRRCLSEHVPIIRELVTNFLDLPKPSLILYTGFLIVTSRPFCLYMLRQDQSLLYQDTLATSPKSDDLSNAQKGRELCAGHHLHRVCVLPAQSSGLESRSTVKACPWQVTHTVITFE